LYRQPSKDSFRQYCSDTCLDIYDRVNVAGIHFAEGREIEGDVVSEHDSVDVLLEDGIALDIEDIESDIAAREESLGSLDDLRDLLVVIVDDENKTEPKSMAVDYIVNYHINNS